MTYEQIKIDQQYQKDTNDCSVVATAVVCDISYASAHKALAASGRVHRKGRFPTQAIKSLGFKFGKLVLSSKTVRTVERELAKDYGGVKILLYTNRHVLAWDGSKIADYTGGRLHRITRAFIIYKDELPILGKSVPVPARQELRGRKGHTATAVMVDGVCYASKPAAYKALGFKAQGRQKARRVMKIYGSCTTQCLPVDTPWYPVWVTFTKAE